MSTAVDPWVAGGTPSRGRRHTSQLDLAELWGLAEQLAGVDGFVPRALLHKPPAILATLLAGAELGLGPMESLRSIHVIEGRVTLSAEVGRALVLAAGHSITFVELTDQRVEVVGRRQGETTTTSVEWTRDRAARAKLASRPVWQAYPRQMLAARASSELCRLLFPDVLAGLELTEALEEGEPEPTAPPRATRVRPPRATVPAPPLSSAESTADEPAEAPARPGERPEPARAGVHTPEVVQAHPAAPRPDLHLAPPPPPGVGPPLPGEELGTEAPPPPPPPPVEPEPEPDPELLPPDTDRGRMQRRLHARMGETFPGVPRQTMDDYRHALVALVTRRREEGGPVTSSAELTEAEQMGLEARLNDLATGRASITHTAHGSLEVRAGGWVYEVELDPLVISSRTEGPL